MNISHRNLHIDDRRGDVYNFGEILLELLTGSTLYDNTRREEGQHLLVPWVCSTTTSSFSTCLNFVYAITMYDKF